MDSKSIKDKKYCNTCERDKNVTDFYVSGNKFDADGRFGVCKPCLKKNIDYSNMQTVKDALLQMNRPFIASIWKSAIEEATLKRQDIFGLYIKTIQLKKFKDLTWNDSVLNELTSKLVQEEDLTVEKNTHNTIFEVTSEMIMRWGSNYEQLDYAKLEDFYQKMKTSNKIETPSDETYLKKLSVISLKMDKELEKGNYGQVKQLGDLFSKYMADSKFRASDKTEADKTGGIRNFSTIYAELEKDDHIPPWEEFRKVKGISQDLVDETIMHIENFTLRLNKIERMTSPPSDTPKVELDDEEQL